VRIERRIPVAVRIVGAATVFGVRLRITPKAPDTRR
jgi:hypothetical protein